MDGAGDTAIEMQGIWKVFGARAGEALAAARRGVPKTQLLEEFGCVLGIADVIGPAVQRFTHAFADPLPLPLGNVEGVTDQFNPVLNDCRPGLEHEGSQLVTQRSALAREHEQLAATHVTFDPAQVGFE